MLSDKLIVRDLVEICAAKGVEYIITSPGSRNAPLNISFNEDPRFTCISVPDERVAAFVALGIGQQTRRPALINCTSGTAALNYAPAIAEAYHQQVPMLVITADRPPEWLHQGEGQTINQSQVFRNYTKKSYDLPTTVGDADDRWAAQRAIAEAIDQTMHYGTPAPVHLNLPFREPLYGMKNYDNEPLPNVTQTVELRTQLAPQAVESLQKIWQGAERIMILAGLLPKNHGLDLLLDALTKADARVVVLSETTANLNFERNFTCIDRLIGDFSAAEAAAFRPDLLLTIGHSIVSKKIKSFLRTQRAAATWHIGLEQFHLDTMQTLTHHIPTTPTDFFTDFLPFCLIKKEKTTALNPELSTTYHALWEAKQQEKAAQHEVFMARCEWSDMKAFELILEGLPTDSDLHQGNSSAVRYVQLFRQRADVQYFANRGVAGIDGCTSTAVGAAIASGRMTTIVTGDISFFYDSNAFWNSHLPANLRVILINNGGGNIFRIIPGPDTSPHLEDFFETHHNLQAVHLSRLFDLTHYNVSNAEDLAATLPTFFAPQQNNRPAILEIVTPRLLNDKVLKGYLR